jgi:hypothetical protein
MQTDIDPMDTFLAFERKKAQTAQGRNYSHRDEIPPALLAHADNYVKLTGQEPDKRTLTDWVAEFTYWETKGLAPADIEKAYRDVEYHITRPGSLTSIAVSIKAKVRASTHESVIFRAAEHQEVKAVPPPSDLYEQTRQRLREKAAMDKVGKSKHEPKPISDVLKGMQ